MKTQELIKRHEKALRLATYLERHEADLEKKGQFFRGQSKRFSRDFNKKIWKSILDRNKSIKALKKEIEIHLTN